MKIVKIEELPSGNYRVRKTVNGKTVSLIFDHKPRDMEALKAITKVADTIPVKNSFASCAESYLRSKENVISPSTIGGYESILRNIPDDFKLMKLSTITQVEVQCLINDYATTHAPKSTHNLHGFVSAVLRHFRPDFILHTTLPQEKPNEDYIPTEEDVRKILDISKGTRYHIPFQLALMGLRRSEVCALTLDDIDFENNILTINKAKVRDEKSNTKWTVKGTKTKSSTRKVYIPDNLVKEIQEAGTIYDGYPGQLLKNLHRFQDILGLPRFRLHDARHFFASYAHSQGVSDADIIATGGWKSDHVMKKVYRHEMKQKEAQKEVFDKLLS